MTDWVFWAVGITVAYLVAFQTRAGRAANPLTGAISAETARELFHQNVSRWHQEAAEAEQLTQNLSGVSTVPTDIILTQVAHESSGRPDANHAGTEHGLGGFTEIAADDLRQNFGSDLGWLSKPRNQWTPAEQIKATALFTGLLRDRHGSWLAALEAYRCGPDRTAPTGDCTEEARARLAQINRD